MSGIPTAGAIPVKNEKGQISMQKVKVQRYISGRRPDYVREDSSESSSEEETDLFQGTQASKISIEAPQTSSGSSVLIPVISHADVANDRRLRRLQRARQSDDDEDGESTKRRRIIDPEIIKSDRHRHRPASDQEESDEKESDDEESIERRRAHLRARRQQQEKEEEEERGTQDAEHFRHDRVGGGRDTNEEEEEEEEEDDEEDEDESDEFEDYSDSDDATPRLKPVFIRRDERLTVLESEKLEKERLAAEREAKRQAEARRLETLRMIEDDRRREDEEKEEAAEEEQIQRSIAACNTDDEDGTVAYETWKLRELKRIKRDKDEREALAREKEDAEKIRNMTEDERAEFFRLNPKEVTNEAKKGKYKFMQKYFHRGAFFLDEDSELLKRNFAEATLEDRGTDKSALPTVMQVKNFGRSGRTKYTHLVDQDTTAQSRTPWMESSKLTDKFYSSQAGGMKQVFERPRGRRRN